MNKTSIILYLIILCMLIFISQDVKFLIGELFEMKQSIYKLNKELKDLQIQQYRTVFETINNYYTNDKGGK